MDELWNIGRDFLNGGGLVWLLLVGGVLYAARRGRSADLLKQGALEELLVQSKDRADSLEAMIAGGESIASMRKEVHLPVLGGDSAPQAPEPRCENCKFFDLEEGQAQLRSHPAFMEAAGHVSPAMMAAKRQMVDDAGNVLVPEDGEDPASSVPYKIGWHDVGACSANAEGVFRTSHCEKYEARS